MGVCMSVSAGRPREGQYWWVHASVNEERLEKEDAVGSMHVNEERLWEDLPKQIMTYPISVPIDSACGKLT